MAFVAKTGFTLIDRRAAKRGFTLIELSIVLVIIGLIIGGVTVGQDLINAATIRAQIAQLEKYQTAVNTFKGKYGGLPGDLTDPGATNFGFVPRGPYQGQGDGNGSIQGVDAGGPTQYMNGRAGGGEAAVFWSDLSTAGLISGSFTSASSNSAPATVAATDVGKYMPAARIGQGNYIYVWSGDENFYNADSGGDNTAVLGINYFGLSAVYGIGGSALASIPGITVVQAYNIDKKIDDGLPSTGTVRPRYVSGDLCAYVGAPLGVASNPSVQCAAPPFPAWIQTPPTAATCIDNNNTAGALATYSMSQNNGAGINCALSFRFQ